MADMNQVLRRLDTLAALPQTVMQVTSMLVGGNASADEIERVARRDEALAMTILRWANSAAYGRPGCSFNLRQGIARLGNSNLLKIVLQQKTSTMFAAAGPAFGLPRGALWRSAVGGAIAAELIARRAGFPEPDTAFLCGLLRDVGKLVLDSFYGPEYMTLVAEHTRPDRTFDQAEREAFGFDHAQLGAQLALRWQLPQRIADCIACHHDPPASPPAHDHLFDVVHAADIVGLWAGLAVGFDGLRYRLADHARLGLNLDRAAVEHLTLSTVEKLRETEELMGRPAIHAAGPAARASA